MTPILSYIIPCRNANAVLHGMLESLLQQTLKEIEVVLVDDASDESCAPVAEAFRSKGLTVKLVESPQRLYTKNARLLGVEHATADIVAFGDADDLLWGTDNLEAHVIQFREEGADILQFLCAMLDADGNYAGLNHNRPLGRRLEGKAILPAYLNGHLLGVWAHLFSRRLWMDILPDVRVFPIRHHFEDLCLLLHYYSNAKTYVGSQRIGYGYRLDGKRDRAFAPQAEKALAIETLRTHFPTYLRRFNVDNHLLDLFKNRILRILMLHVGRASIASLGEPQALKDLSDEQVLQLLPLAAAGVLDNAAKLTDMYTRIFAAPAEDLL